MCSHARQALPRLRNIPVLCKLCTHLRTTLARTVTLLRGLARTQTMASKRASSPGASASPAKRVKKILLSPESTVASVEAPSVDAFVAAVDPPDSTREFRVVSWNVNGLRGLMNRSDVLAKWAAAEAPDVLFLNETKVTYDVIAPDSSVKRSQSTLDSFLGGSKPAADASEPPSASKKKAKPKDLISAASVFGEGVFVFEKWACSTEKKGYAGVTAFCKTAPDHATIGLGNPALDQEGRVVTLEFPKIAIVGVYTPNSGQKLERLEFRRDVWDPAFQAHLAKLEERFPNVLVLGDMNAAYRDFDVYDGSRMRNKVAGFCDSERAAFATYLAPKNTYYAPPVGIEDSSVTVEIPPEAHPAAYASDIGQSAPGMGFHDCWIEANDSVRMAEWTFFSMRFGMRPKQKGWRIDYVLASDALSKHVVSVMLARMYLVMNADVQHRCFVRRTATGSDHLPLGVDVARTAVFGDSAE
jgi:exonuclease III